MPTLGGYPVNRVVLKISGEALKHTGEVLQPQAIEQTADRVCRFVRDHHIETALVVGAGNIVRGVTAQTELLTRTTADTMGMLATMVNSLAVRDAIEALGLDTELMAPWSMPGVCCAFDARSAQRALQQKTVVILAGGTGHPYFTTDTTAALRACEVQADAVLKATKVNGVYSADPNTDAQAERYRRLAFQHAVRERLAVMDATAFAMCEQNNLPIVVFNFTAAESLDSVLNGSLDAATVVGAVSTETDTAGGQQRTQA